MKALVTLIQSRTIFFYSYYNVCPNQQIPPLWLLNAYNFPHVQKYHIIINIPSRAPILLSVSSVAGSFPKCLTAVASTYECDVHSC